MTTCPECGAAVTPDVDFCPQCDAYLAWETPGGRPAGKPPTKPEPRRAPDAAPTPPEPVAAAGTPDAAPAAAAEEYDHDPPVVSIPVITIPPWPFAADDAVTAPVTSGGSARTPAAAAGKGDPVAVLPGRAAPKAPAAGPAPASSRSTKDGAGVQCVTCGAWNTPGRHFCSSCGADIAAAPPPPTTTAPPRRTTSGFRKRSGGGRLAVILVVVGVVAALAVGAIVLRDPLQSFAASALDRVVGVAAVNPSKVTASGSAPGHPANAAHDGASNIAWEAAAPGAATGDRLAFAFDRPFRLVVVQVLPGAATDQPTFLKSRRPTEVRLAIERAGAPAVVRTLRLADQPGPQRFDVGIEQVTRVRMTILQSSGPPGARVAIAEVEFSGR